MIRTSVIAGSVMALAMALSPQGWAQSARRAPVIMRAPAAAGVRTAPRAPLVGTALFPNFAPIPGGSAAVPGLGFDYDHVVAVDRPHRDTDGHLHRDFDRNDRNFHREFITPIFFDAGFPLYDYTDFGYESELQQPAQPGTPTVIVLQQPPQTTAAQPPPAVAAPQPTLAPPDAPVRDVGDFILVRRDGQVALAAAFTISGDRLTYVTREGTRRSFPVAELDTTATRQMNDANGTSLTLPQ